MTNHPNRTAKRWQPGQPWPAGATPTAEQVRAARQAAGLTQEQARALVYAGSRTWEAYEAADAPSQRTMPADRFELFLLKTGLIELAPPARGGEA